MTNKIKYNYVEYKVKVLNQDHEYDELGSSNISSKYKLYLCQFKKYREEIYESIEELMENLPIHRHGKIVTITETLTLQGESIYKELKGHSRSKSLELKILNIMPNLVVEYLDIENGIVDYLAQAIVTHESTIIVGESYIHENVIKHDIVKMIVGLKREILIIVLTCHPTYIADLIFQKVKVLRDCDVHLVKPVKQTLKVKEVVNELKYMIYNWCW